MEMGGNFCQILELGGTTIKGRRVQGITYIILQDVMYCLNCGKGRLQQSFRLS